LLPAKPDPLLTVKLVSPRPAKPDAPLPACSQSSHFHLYQQSLIHSYQLAPSEARFTANSLVPAKPDCQRGESEHSTASSLLPAKPLSYLPVKPDPPLPASSQQSQIHCYQLTHSEASCSQRSQIVRDVRVSVPPLPACSQQSQIHCSQQSQIQCYQQSQIHRYQLVYSETTLSER
jgi:hypothetical protein